MKGLIDALLTYSRVVNVEGLPFGPVRLEAGIHSASMNLQAAIEESRAKVTHDPLPTVLADQVQLVQLFQNLMSNAIKYRLPEVPPHIHISAAQTARHCVVSVRDNGIGIDPDQAERIFGVFERLHGKDIPGTGIGLAICKRIVEKHGGNIWVESSRGEGATFRFTLPCAPAK
jgi:light-regulated signal transduction histidine kinase (bacteriophytochrome)